MGLLAHTSLRLAERAGSRRGLEGLGGLPIGALRSTWHTVNGLRIHTRVSAQPVPGRAWNVVLLHGLVASSTYMVPTAMGLAPHFRVYAPDLPGFGRSQKPRRPLDVAGLADSLAAWMDAAGLANPALVANASGCQFAVDFASRYPERCGPLVLLGPSLDARHRATPRQVMRWLAEGVREPASLSVILAQDYRTFGALRALKALRSARDDAPEEKLPHVRTPVLVVRGEKDRIVPHARAEELVRSLPQGRLEEVPGASHMLNFNSPEAVVKLIRRYLYELEARGDAAP
ncbi:alpha/beta fold hydrolase [Pyxidicoccus xibeiensis]|uniref:alpha/beta fold hydrolase n=1 Tax=Pyxidicoccus xibeiensis TaxID=2906759 RepID=UPI0020A7F7AD|nr:alpha/beta hydrolase [Pyxidicoccus xibeiensis]MCP3135833.1 alpha/beta hydrolase [Pyxidicoccus xibeiensis]